jgi:hypothetical protein
MNQLGFPSEVTGQEVMRERDLGGAIALCAKAAGLEAKQVQDMLKADKAQFSRWQSGAEGIVWPKLRAAHGFLRQRRAAAVDAAPARLRPSARTESCATKSRRYAGSCRPPPVNQFHRA